MGRSTKENRPYNLKPVKRIELSEKNTTLRAVLAITLLVVGAVAIGVGVFSLLTTDPGWTVIENDSSELNCSDEFVLNYCLGMGEDSATAEKKNITALYSALCSRAYKIFSTDADFEGISNTYTINSNVNAQVVIDEVLYRAFELALSHESRAIYLSALFAEYENNFFGYDTSSVVEDCDPYVNEDFASLFATMASFASSDEHIRLELLGNNTVKLCASEEYLAFAKEYEVTDLVGFSWFKNAFIIDYMASALIERGYTCGNITSYDGYVRNLDTRSDAGYVFNLFNRAGTDVFISAKMNYKGGISIVTLRDYPLSENDVFRYFTLKDGSSITPYIDINDGLYRSATDTLTFYSSDGMGCAEILISSMEAYICEDVDLELIKALSDKRISAVWSDDTVVKYTDKDIDLFLQEYEGRKYTKAYAFD